MLPAATPATSLDARTSVPRRLVACVGLVLASFAAVLMMAAVPSPAAAAIHTEYLGTSGISFQFVDLDPALMTAGDDPNDEQLAFVLPFVGELDHSYLAYTIAFDFGYAKLEKEFLDLRWTADYSRGTSYYLRYSVGGAYLPAGTSGGKDLPDGTHGRTLSISVEMKTYDPALTPTFDDITIEWKRWTGKPTKPDGDGSGVSHKPDAGTRDPGSGTYTYPSSSGSGGTGGGTGTGSGTGSGSGSGTGTGSGSGSGSGQGADGSSANANSVPTPPVDSSGAGAATTVSGLAVGADEQVIGVPFRATSEGGSEGGSGSAAGDSSPGGAAGGLSIPFLVIACVVAFLGAVFFVPWVITAASLRRFNGFDEKRARLAGPFGPPAR